MARGRLPSALAHQAGVAATPLLGVTQGHPRCRLLLLCVGAAQWWAQLEPTQVVLEQLVVPAAQQLRPAATAACVAPERVPERRG
eukprot:scaffold128907_cov21-Phaeocystis_antarctica.AAC.1